MTWGQRRCSGSPRPGFYFGSTRAENFFCPKYRHPNKLFGRRGLLLQQLQHQGVMLTPTPLRGAAEQDAKILAMGKNLRQGDIAHPRWLEKKIE